MNSYPRETDEVLTPTITDLNTNTRVTTGVKFAIVPNDGSRPTTWTAPTVIGGIPGATINGLSPGTYHLYAQITSNPEVVVVDCGAFQIL